MLSSLACSVLDSRTSLRCAVDDYVPRDYFRMVPIVDGTAVMSARVWETVGSLDERTPGRFGRGSDIDLSIHVARAGFGLRS